MNERFFKQAWEVYYNNDAKPGDIIDAFHLKCYKDGISPVISTRPEGFKTAILVVTSSIEAQE